MAQCITVGPAGEVIALPNAASECPGYVLLSGSEYVAVSISEGIFALPTAADASAWFTGPLFLVLFLYCVGRGAGGVVNMFR